MNSKKYSKKLYEVREASDLKDIITQSTSLFAEETAYLVKNRRIGKFVPITYGKVKQDLDGFGTKLIDMGLKGKKIAVIGESSYYWILTYFTTVAGVGVIVPLDKNLPQEELLGLIERSGASAIVYSDKVKKSIQPIFENPCGIEFFISMDSEEDTEEAFSMGNLIDRGRDLLKEGNRAYVDANIDPDQMATLLFTSGTTGMAKGVMMSQRNIAANCVNMSKYFKIPDPGIVLSILPIHHAYEMTCDIWTTFYQGKTIAICQGLRYIQKNMAEVKANVLLGVPLVFEKMYKGMWKQAESRGEAEKLRNAIDLSRKLKLYNNKSICRRMFKAIHQSFGGAMEKFVAGGAAIDPKVIEDFEAMGFTMIQGYGMTENGPIVCVNQDRYSKAASVGKPVPKTEVRIINSDEDGIGEVICKGPSVMLGYYENQEATDEVLHDGWLHTGDLGYMDEEGFVYLTGRKKTVIVTKGGKNIFPEELETVLMEDEHIQEVLVHGVEDGRVGNVVVTADIYPNYKLLTSEKGKLSSSEIYHFYKELVEDINNKFPPNKRIKRISIRDEEFVKTTTGKIKRFGNNTEAAPRKEKYPECSGEIRKKQEKKARSKIKALTLNEYEGVAYNNVRPIPELKTMLETSADIYGNNVAIYQKFESKKPYVGITYKQLLADVNSLGTALLNRNFKDKRIAVIGKNCYQWAVSYLAAVCGVGICVPLDKELPAKELKQLVMDSGASCVLLDKAYEDVFCDMRDEKDTDLELLVNFESGNEEKNIMSFEHLIEEGQKQLSTGDRQFLDAEIDAEKMAVILYTSGTTGVAKGVMLSHANICDNLMGAPTFLHVTEDDIFFSVLPIHHTYECTCGLLIPLYMGSAIAYCQGLRHIEKNMKEIKPTIFLGVPLLLEGLYKKIWKEIKKQGKAQALKKILILNGLSKKINVNLVKPFVKDIRKVFGGRMKILISGGAAINPKVLEFFNDIGFIAIQGYGLTECSPLAALNPDRSWLMRSDSAGHVMPGMEVKVVNKGSDGVGEIVFKGPSVMLGYYNNKEATEEVLRGGWFYTGDLGYVDNDGYIYITGRLKNVIITQNGKNVYPEELENYLKNISCIDEAMVWGQNSEIDERDTIIAATVTLDEEALTEAIGENYTDEEKRDFIWEEVDKINENLPLFKKIRKVVIKEDDFEKTTAKKIKRFVSSNKES